MSEIRKCVFWEFMSDGVTGANNLKTCFPSKDKRYCINNNVAQAIELLEQDTAVSGVCQFYDKNKQCCEYATHRREICDQLRNWIIR